MAANAAELNINGVSDMPLPASRSPASASFRCVSDRLGLPALSNLIERYGCVAGYPNGTYRGNRAMTRYEVATAERLPRPDH